MASWIQKEKEKTPKNSKKHKKTTHKTRPKHKLGNERGREAFSEGKLEAVSPAKQHMFYGVMKFPWLI